MKIQFCMIDTSPETPRTASVYHAAVVIGPWLVEWNEGSLCLPHPVALYRPPLVWDVKRVVGEENVRWYLNRLGATIVDWNSTMLYVEERKERGPFLSKFFLKSKVIEDIDPRSPQMQKWVGNSQDFVLNLLHNIGMHLDEGSVLGKFVSLMGPSALLTDIPTAEARSISADVPTDAGEDDLITMFFVSLWEPKVPSLITTMVPST